jgi:hypothetical protein
MFLSKVAMIFQVHFHILHPLRHLQYGDEFLAISEAGGAV